MAPSSYLLKSIAYTSEKAKREYIDSDRGWSILYRKKYFTSQRVRLQLLIEPSKCRFYITET